MKARVIAIIAMAAVAVFLTACGGQVEYYQQVAPIVADTAEYYAPEEEPPRDSIHETEIAVPIQLTVDSVPYGAEPADFVRELGYDSFAEDEFLNWGIEWLVLRTNVAIQGFRFITVVPRYEASFNNGWQIERHYTYTWSRHTVDLLPDEPFVMMWQAERGLTESGLEGVAFVDADGYERYFVMKRYNDGVHIVEFENIADLLGNPRISVINPSPEIELVVAWIVAPWLAEDGQGVSEGKGIFLQQFETYVQFDNPYASTESWAIFSANTDLHDFVFFRLGQICDPWVDEEWRPFYIGTGLGHQERLLFGTALVVPWSPGGTMPSFGFGFYDENGTRRNFSLNSNEGSGFPPMFMLEFVDRGACGGCEWCE